MSKAPLALALALCACGDTPGGADAAPSPDASAADAASIDAAASDGGSTDAGSDSGPTDAGLGGQVLELIAGDWTMPAGREGYICVRRTVERTLWVREFRPIAPVGTHHTVLTVRSGATTPDGVSPCNAATNYPTMIYGSGVGTDPFTFPAGVAVKVEAGQQLLLNLHLFNTGADDLAGHSGIEIVTADPSEVEHEAQAVLAGQEFFSIPPRSSDFEVDGRCTMPADVTVFAVMPHMHELGVFMRVTANTSDGAHVLHEDFYSFDDQRYTILSPLRLQAGDTIDVNCHYDNPTDSSVPFGDSTRQEMCYAGIYRYPPVGSGLTCTR